VVPEVEGEHGDARGDEVVHHAVEVRAVVPRGRAPGVVVGPELVEQQHAGVAGGLGGLAPRPPQDEAIGRLDLDLFGGGRQHLRRSDRFLADQAPAGAAREDHDRQQPAHVASIPSGMH